MKDQQFQGFYEFASFRLDIKTHRLMHGDDAVALTPKEFGVLLFLIENAGRVVGKDELLEAVWADTFVEEGTLTRNISWLRKKLAAHAGGDIKIIETLPKRGYRFLPEIAKGGETEYVVEEQTVQHIEIEEIIEIEVDEKFGVPPSGDSEFIDRALPPEGETSRLALPAAPVKNRFSTFWITPAVLILAAFAFAAYHGYFFENQPKTLLLSKIAPFSGLPGRENSPAFSPDGRQMVFSWDGGIENGNFDVYVKLVGAGEPVRLTSGETDEINPIFSPDGKSIAFVRLFPTHNEIILIPALGGAERRIYERASYASLSFTPDGNELAHAELDASNNETGIFTINLQTGERTRLTTPAAPAVDHTPRFSPDGNSLAFIRHFSTFRREIFVVPGNGGEPRQITADDSRIYGLAWSADSRALFFTSFRAVNLLNLWHVSAADQAEPQMISTGSKNLNDLAISPNGRTIAFVEETADENIWEVRKDEGGRMKDEFKDDSFIHPSSFIPHPLIRSSRADHSQQFSPDGRQIVFASDRTGNYEIWLADADGKNQRQLTDSQSSAGSPRFSPDGKFVAYDAQVAGGSDVFVISVNGGTPRRLTADAKNNSLPAWSVDGEWIFFLSDRSGDAQIWKMPASGAGETVPLTKQGAFEAFAAPGGKTLIYSKGAGKSGLWGIGVNGEDEKPLPELGDAGAWRSWSVTANGVFYTAFSSQVSFRVKFYDFQSGQTRQLLAVDKSPLNYYANLAVSPDGKRILYARQDQTYAGIILAELAE